MEDWDLAKQAAHGDRDAFAALVRRYQQPILHFCLRMTGSLPDAEDACQETFLRLYRALGTLKPEYAFSTVLYCFARNATLNHLRSRNRHARRLMSFMKASGEVSRDADRPDLRAHSEDIAALIQEGILALPEEFREVLVLREFQKMDYQGIADILKCPIGTVRSRLARAREQLRQHLLRYGDDLL